MSNGETEAVINYEPIPEWPVPCRSLMINPTVTIKFRGLLAFCYNDDTSECEVGVHNQSDHFLSVQVFEGDESVHNWKDHAAAVVNEAYFLKGSAQTPFVCFYHPDPKFDRGSGDPKDFRWILDLETSEFYSRESGKRRRLERRGSTLRPRFTLDTGEFYTERRSKCTYRRQDFGGGSIVTLGKIAAEIGVNIFLGPKDFADIRLPGGFNARFTAGKKYGITFRNDCDDESCIDPTSNNPELQNDFHFYHSTFNRRADDPLLYLMKEDAACLEPIPGHDEGSDRAPCAASGFGSGGGLGG